MKTLLPFPSQSFPFPYPIPVLSNILIPIRMGIPWDSWEPVDSNSCAHLYRRGDAAVSSLSVSILSMYLASRYAVPSPHNVT